MLLGFGDTHTFSDCRLFGESKVWRSLTPFVSTRHPKTHRDGRPKLTDKGTVWKAAYHLPRALMKIMQLFERVAQMPEALAVLQAPKEKS